MGRVWSDSVVLSVSTFRDSIFNILWPFLISSGSLASQLNFDCFLYVLSVDMGFVIVLRQYRLGGSGVFSVFGGMALLAGVRKIWKRN